MITWQEASSVINSSIPVCIYKIPVKREREIEE
jgi:hypothetical protein